LYDFGTQEGVDVFELVKRLFKLNYHQAITKMLEDGKHLEINEKPNLTKNDNYTYIISPEKHPYFDRYNIKEATLKKYDVHTVKAVYKNEKLMWRGTSTNPIFVYIWPDTYFKLYRPLTTRSEEKWLSVANIKHIHGYHQLPPTGKILIITSSLKDTMVLHDKGYPAIAFNSEVVPTKGENVKFITDILAHLSMRFEHIITLMDNDAAGKKAKDSWKKHYKIDGILIPDGKPKDISDFIEKYKSNRASRLLKKLISKLFNNDKADFLSFVDNSSLVLDSGNLDDSSMRRGE
jgi:hypothetical protein